MSQEIGEESQAAAGHASGPQQAATNDAEAEAVITKFSGEDWNIRLRIKPVQSEQGDGQASGITAVQDISLSFNGSLLLQDDNSAEAQRRKWFKDMRGWLMVLATVAASVTYQAGLNPPGGFWQDDPRDKSHHAADPALHDEHHARYYIFYYFNATAFVMSLVIMVLLMSERFYHTEGKVLALLVATIIDLASLIVAYIAGTTRYFSSCIYIIVITCVAFVAVIYMGEVMAEICSFVLIAFPCMETLAQNRWCPILDGAVDKAKRRRLEIEEKAHKKKLKKARTSNNGTCCLCCA